ncbi:hypothetical protein DERP_003225 [Dermatophagoides pteronyssinus]|uniref:Uncharacterized protein n=1 Tax=Dermatophagoides pteronyssinus TaxID=6956 RepID=A0ABQ8JJ03_DERPT|nr:hypothetical protein DERP_003225 [Dermatophagoides pteronyssinus]
MTMKHDELITMNMLDANIPVNGIEKYDPIIVHPMNDKQIFLNDQILLQMYKVIEKFRPILLHYQLDSLFDSMIILIIDVMIKINI